MVSGLELCFETPKHEQASQDGPQGAASDEINVEDKTLLGCGTTILLGVTVGAVAKVAPGAVFTRDFAPVVTVGDVPARAIVVQTQRQSHAA